MQAAALHTALNPALSSALSPALSPSLSPALSSNALPATGAAVHGNAQLAGAGGSAGSFSRLLEAADARRQAEHTDERPHTEPPKPASAHTAPRPPTPPAKTGAPAVASAVARSTVREAGAESRRNEAAAGTETAEDSTEAEATTGDTGALADPAALLASLGLGLGLRPAPASDSARGRGAVAREGTDIGTGLAGKPARAGEDGYALVGGADAAARRDASGEGSAGANGSQPGAPFEALLGQIQAQTQTQGQALALANAQAPGSAAQAGTWTAEVPALATPGATLSAEARPADASLQGLAAAVVGALGAPAAAAAPGSSASPTAEARLSHSPGSAAFASELGAQISTYVREGVQHARLQLHPLELGPVTVQIQLDGGSAHLSFAAEHAQTRLALEQALPTLASGLREAGLTLSGGGVFEQPRQQAPADSGNGNGSGRPGRGGEGEQADAVAAPAAGAGSPARRRGVVDLVA